MGLGFQTAVDEAGSSLKSRGFKYYAGVFCGGEARWWLLLIGLHLETIIREADVRHRVDLPRRN